MSAESPDGHAKADSAMLRAKPGVMLSRLLLEKDKLIFSEGQDSHDAFVIESGRVGIFKTIEGKPVRLAVLEKGAVFGEMAAIVTNARRSATAVALEHTTIVRISGTAIQHKIAACDPFVKALLNILIANLNRTTENYALKAAVAEQLVRDLHATLGEHE
jgi:CRP-like cAMP-binding protein